VLIDARHLTIGSQFECDVCVVGAGFAGIAIADRLRDSGLSIVLLESGGFQPELSTQKLYRGEVHGQPYYRLDACRWRLFGGGGNRWGGWCRPLEAIDFTKRDWIAHSGWPISAETLKPYEAHAARLLELPNAEFDLSAWRHRLPDPLPLDDETFEHAVFQHSPETNFGETCRARLLDATNITTIIHANVTQIRLGTESTSVNRVDVASLTGQFFTVRPKATVLAAGGIENARLLLASRADRPAGLGNEFDVVGRYFMDHLHVPMGHLVAAAGTGSIDFYKKTLFHDVRLRGVITPTATAQVSHRLLGTSIAFESASYYLGTPFVGWPPALTHVPIRCYRMLRRGHLKPLALSLKQFAQGASSIPMRIQTWRRSHRARYAVSSDGGSTRLYSLYFRSEQPPHPSNRVTLLARRDALGIPEARLDWKVNAQESASMLRWLDLLDASVRARGIGVVIPPPDDWQSHIGVGPHHAGTTRMSADPRNGVVDATCRVHSVENLYVAGSSVFATSGYANPTFTLITLALHLADTLRQRLQPATTFRSDSMDISAVLPSSETGARVGGVSVAGT
jgi:choline dehydrogenase-like flavoprotein